MRSAHRGQQCHKNYFLNAESRLFPFPYKQTSQMISCPSEACVVAKFTNCLINTSVYECATIKTTRPSSLKLAFLLSVELLYFVGSEHKAP